MPNSCLLLSHVRRNNTEVAAASCFVSESTKLAREGSGGHCELWLKEPSTLLANPQIAPASWRFKMWELPISLRANKHGWESALFVCLLYRRTTNVQYVYKSVNKASSPCIFTTDNCKILGKSSLWSAMSWGF